MAEIIENLEEISKILEKDPCKDLPSLTPTHNVCYNINTGYDESDEFVCSNCGIQLRGWYSIKQYPDGDIEYNDYEFKFCPNCGARIKRIE